MSTLRIKWSDSGPEGVYDATAVGRPDVKGGREKGGYMRTDGTEETYLKALTESRNQSRAVA